MGRKSVITREQETALDRQLLEVRRQGRMRENYARIRAGLQALIVGVVAVEDRQKAKSDLAAARQAWFATWFQKLGLPGVIPLPDASNRDFARWQKEGRGLFFRHPDYAAFLTAVGQPKHWTLVEEDRHKVGFEPISEGNWFLGDIASECPRLGTTHNQLMTDLSGPRRLISIEEYFAEWWAVKEELNILLDRCTWSWTRTTFGSGALYAGEGDGGVDVTGRGLVNLSIPRGDFGGRSAEVVKNAV